jgi:hypothetical protein
MGRYKNIRFYKVRIIDSKMFFPNCCYLYIRILHCERGNIGRPEDACGTQGEREEKLRFL